jgi:hypothetical protein
VITYSFLKTANSESNVQLDVSFVNIPCLTFWFFLFLNVAMLVLREWTLQVRPRLEEQKTPTGAPDTI